MLGQRRKRITALLAIGALDRHRLGLCRLRPGKGEIQGAFAPLPREGADAVSGKMEG